MKGKYQAKVLSNRKHNK